MKQRALGRSGPAVFPVGLGCMGLNQSYPPFPKKKEAIAFLRKAVDMGENFFDTSELCGICANEELVGEALEPVRELIPTLEELGIGLVPFSPLGKGFLTGTVTGDQTFADNDIRRTIPRFNDPENLAKNQAPAEAVKVFARRRCLSPAQVALAWLLRQRPWIIPIPGSKTVDRLRENMSAAYVELSREDWAELAGLLDSSVIYGERYSPAMLRMTGR